MLELERHANRFGILKTSLVHILLPENGYQVLKVDKASVSVERILPIMKNSLGTAIRQYIDKYPETSEEMKLTLLLTNQSEEVEHNGENGWLVLYTHVSPLGKFPDKVIVEVRKANRQNPTVKDLKWVR